MDVHGLGLRDSLQWVTLPLWAPCSATANPDGRRRALVVGGGIANFTSVAGTFTGIVKAMREQVTQFSQCGLSPGGFTCSKISSRSYP